MKWVKDRNRCYGGIPINILPYVISYQAGRFGEEGGSRDFSTLPHRDWLKVGEKVINIMISVRMLVKDV